MSIEIKGQQFPWEMPRPQPRYFILGPLPREGIRMTLVTSVAEFIEAFGLPRDGHEVFRFSQLMVRSPEPIEVVHGPTSSAVTSGL